MNQNNSTEFFSFIFGKTCTTTVGTRSDDKNLNWRPSRRSSINLKKRSIAGLHSVSFSIFLTVNVVWKCVCHLPVLVSGSAPCASPPVTCLTPHCVSACLGHSLGHNLDISHLNDAVVICQTPLSVSSPCVCRRSRVMLCDRCLSGTMHLSVRA